VLGSSKATNVACLAVFDPDTKSALSRPLVGIELFVSKSGFASERHGARAAGSAAACGTWAGARAPCYPGRVVNLLVGVFLQLNLPRTAANRTLLLAERHQ
jgi:hypothetical protein